MSYFPRRRRACLLSRDAHPAVPHIANALSVYGFDTPTLEIHGDTGELLRAIRGREPDVILAVLEQPEMNLDGLSSLLRELKQDARMRQIHTLAVAHGASDDQEARLFDAGFSDVVVDASDPVNVVIAARRLALEVIPAF